LRTIQLMKHCLRLWLVCLLFVPKVQAQWTKVLEGVSGTSPILTCGDTIFLDATNRSTDLGVTWTHLDQSPLTWKHVYLGGVQAMVKLGSFYFIGTSENFYRSSDMDTNWVAIDSIFRALDPINHYASISTLITIGTRIIAGSRWGTFYSDDNGSTWHGPSGIGPSSFAIMGTTLYESQRNYGSSEDDFLYRSTDSGVTWSPMHFHINGGPDTRAVAALSNTLIVATNGSRIGGSTLWWSTDSGTSWEEGRSDSGLESSTSLVTSGANVFAGTAGDSRSCVMLSSDLGVNWSSVGPDSIYAKLVYHLATGGGYLFAETSGSNFNALWRRPLSDFDRSAVLDRPLQPCTISISPNPMTSSATITFEAPTKGSMEIGIFNLLGVEVARIFSGEVDPGERFFRWNRPSGLPAGIYECMLRIGDHVESRPIIIEP
jgi:hypothetical protein